MSTVDASDFRIPAAAREALARHKEVVVLSHGRPAYVIVNREDYERSIRRMPGPGGRTLRDAFAILSSAPPPGPAFADDMAVVLESC